MNRKQPKIEDLLEQMGSQDLPGDSEHRYELRRALLCSRYFGDNCSRQSRWEVFMSYTAPLVAGTVVVGVFAFMATSVSPEMMRGTGQVTVAQEFQNNEPRFDSQANAAMFLSDASAPLVKLADFAEYSSEPSMIRFVPMTPGTVATVR